MRKQALAHLSLNGEADNLCVTYYHPIAKDSKNTSKKRRIRRGLDTKNLTEAKKLVESLNEIILDEYWHTSDKYQEAKDKYGKLVASIFYDHIDSKEYQTVCLILQKVMVLRDWSTENLEYIDDILKDLEGLKDDLSLRN